jgi:hypothetical protein
MRNWLSQFKGTGRQLLLVIIVQLMIVQPLFLHLPTTVKAADGTPTYHDDATCASTVMAEFTGQDPVAKPDPTAADPEALPESSIVQSINITQLKNDTRYPQVVRNALTTRQYIDSVVQYYGGTGMTYLKLPDKITYADPNSEWVFVCNTAQQTIDPIVFSPFTPMSTTALDVLDAMANPNPRLVFKNPQDLYAVIGENCAGGFDESKKDTNENPCKSFNTADDFYANGVWDAPKVADKVAATLAYLVTPTERGGAGREYIRVKKVVQFGKDDITLGTTPVQTDTTSVAASDPSADADAADLAASSGTGPVTVGATNAGASKIESSSYTIDQGDPPYKPKKVSSSILIDQIDKIRVTTKTVEKRFFGNNTITYRYQAPFPVDVAWQSDAGLAADPAPDFSNLSLLQSSRYLTNAAIVQMLNRYGLGDLSIDTSSMDINNFGDVAMMIGQSLLEQLLGSPNGSMSGWDLQSNLQSIGLTYLEQQMGLVPGAISDRNPLDDIKEGADFSNVIGSIGRATVEYILGFPRGSLYPLDGTSSQLLESVGRRYLEQEVFKVSWGTLTPDAAHPLSTVSDLLTRLGEGRMEQIFKLPRQSLRKDSYDQFRSSSYKAGLLFTKDSSGGLTTDDYAMADFISNQLQLTYTPYTYIPVDDKGNKGTAIKANTNMYGFSEADFNNPAVEIAPTDLTKFKQLVGSRAIESSLGIFRREGGTQVATEYNGTPPQTVSDGLNLNFQFRPQSHDYRGVTKNWCEQTEFKSQYFADPSNSDDIRNQLQKLKTDGFKIQSSYGPSKEVACVDAKQTSSQSIDTDPAVAAQQALFTTTPVQRIGFVNQANEPTSDQIQNNLNNDSPQEMSALLNTALLLYYNLPENQRPYTINTVSLGTTADKQVTLSSILNEVVGGSSGSTTGFKFNSDPELGKRLNMIKELMSKAQSTQLFNLDLIKDLPTNELNNALIDRINTLTIQPSKDSFAAQYNQADYNGWLFLISDVRARLKCKLTNGIYQLSDDGLSYSCTAGTSSDASSALDKTATSKINGAIALVDQLYKTPWTMASTLIASLDAGAVQDPSGFSGQSMLSAAVGLSGQTYRMDDNRRFLKDNPQYTQDLMRLLIAPGRNADGTVPLSGDISNFFKTGDDGMSNLAQVGKQYAARKFSKDTLAQRTFGAQLQTDFKDLKESANKDITLYDKAIKDSKAYGIDFNSLQDKGMADGDFQRIFMLDDASAVFERVGKEEILRAVWQRTGAAKIVKSTDQYTSILKDLKDVSQKITFYTSRFDQIDRKTADLDSKIARIDGDSGFQQARDNLHVLRDKNKDKSSTNIKDIQNVVSSYEPVLNALRKKTAVNDVNGVSNDIYDIMHLIEEIIAGKQLPQQQHGSIDPNGSLTNAINGTRSEDSCFTKSDLLKTFTGKGDVLTGIKALAFSVAGCQVDVSFGLPKGSMNNWYQLGSKQFPPADVQFVYQDDPNGGDPIPVDVDINRVGESNKQFFKATTVNGQTTYTPLVPTWNKNSWNINNFQIAVGIANHDEGGAKTDLNNLTQKSANEINGFNDKGKQILDLTLLSKLTQLIPGIGNLMKQYGLTTRDFVKIMQGDTLPLASKIGGGILDQALNLPRGTAAALINPVCHDNSGATAKCDKAPGQAGRDPDNARLETAAAMGLRALGLSVPQFPSTFSFTSGGNLLENWGNAYISQALNLAPNSFSGNISKGIYSSDPNYTAECTASPIRCQNTTFSLATTFGLSTTPELRNLTAIKLAIKNIVQATSVPDYEKGFFNVALEDSVDKMAQQITFARLSDPAWQTKGWWGDPKNGADLLLPDFTAYSTTFVNQLWTMPETFHSSKGSRLFSSDTIKQIRLAILHNQGELGASDISDTLANFEAAPTTIYRSTDDLTTQLGSRYQSYVTYFQSRVNSLNKQFNPPLKSSDNTPEDQSFGSFLRGSIDASKINKSVGMEKTVNAIMGTALDKWVDNQGPTWMKNLNAAFKEVTADKDICGTETGFGSFMAKLITSTETSCSFAGLKGTSTNEILYSADGNYKRLRGILFDNYLSNMFSGNLEKELGFHTGTFRAIAVDPKRGDQILISEGVRHTADQIFGSTPDLNSCSVKAIPNSDCLQSTLERSLKDAFMAGFYDPYKKKYTLDFQTTRSVNGFNASINKALDKQLGRIGKQYLGVEITRADFNLVLHGDNRFFPLIGLQYTANQLNKQLLSSAAGKNPAASSFIIKYADIRDAVGLPSPQEIGSAEKSAQYNFLVQSSCATSDGGGFFGFDNIFCYGIPVATLKTEYMQRLKEERIKELSGFSLGSDVSQKFELSGVDTDGNGIITSEELDAYKKAPLNKDTYIKNLAAADLDAAGKQGSKAILHNQQVEAQNKVMYGMLDILAFSKDQNVPKGFSIRLLGASSTDRLTALAEYGFNSLLRSDTGLGKALLGICGGEAKRAECFTFFRDLSVAVTSGSDSASKLQGLFKNNSLFIDHLDSAFTTYFDKILDVKLPPGIFKGIYTWAMGGFKAGDFNKESLCFQSTAPDCKGGFTGIPVGRVIEKWGIDTISKWADKQFGLPVGTAYKFVQAAQLISTIQRLTSTYNWYTNELNYINDNDLWQTDYAADILAGAAKNEQLLNLTKGKLAQLVGSTIAGLFKSQLSEADKALGLPQGTTQMLVGAGLTYGIASMIGNPAKLLGKGFWVGVAIQLGFQLAFGVVGVEVTNRGDGDGYYPFYDHGATAAQNDLLKFSGGGGTSVRKPDYPEHVTGDALVGEFDPSGIGYHAALKKVAQEKVTGLILDLLRMPSSPWANTHGFNGKNAVTGKEDGYKNLWIEQLFTYGTSDFNPMIDPRVVELYTQPAPSAVSQKLLSGFGYGTAASNCSSVVNDPISGFDICTRRPEIYSGFYPLKSLIDAVHIRW